jgi:hypothetical protein
MISGEPILFNNYYYFYMTNIIQKTIKIYTIEKNRFSYITNNDTNNKSTIMFKLMQFPLIDNDITNNIIKINFSTDKNGYINCQIKNKNKENINNFTYEDFDIIKELSNEYEYILSWNKISIIPVNEFYLEIEGCNFKIFSISGNIL